MKRKMTLLLMLLVGVLVSGCFRIIDIPDAVFSVISDPGVINEPLLNNIAFGYNRYAQPGQKIVLDWRTGRDNYGSPSGLSDDSVWRMERVTIEVSGRPGEDSVFWPASEPENVCVWFPTWIGPVDGGSGLPYSLTPMSVQPEIHPNYPWDPCAPHPIDGGPERTATIYASAKAEYVEVELALAKLVGGESYEIEWPGIPATTHTSGGVIRKRLDTAGTIIVTGPDGVSEYDLPVDEFWCDAVFERLIAPTGWCGLL